MLWVDVTPGSKENARTAASIVQFRYTSLAIKTSLSLTFQAQICSFHNYLAFRNRDYARQDS